MRRMKVTLTFSKSIAPSKKSNTKYYFLLLCQPLWSVVHSAGITKDMASPCPRCGDTRAEPLRRSVFYGLFKAAGYRLSECARCKRKRVFSRDKQAKSHHHHGFILRSDAVGAFAKISDSPPETPRAFATAAGKGFAATTGQTDAAAFIKEAVPIIPAAINASTEIEPPSRPPGPLLRAEADTAPQPGINHGEESEKVRHNKTYTCPVCGSRDCRRSRRTFWENIRRRPKMMRCRSCRRRFPHPSSEDSEK